MSSLQIYSKTGLPQEISSKLSPTENKVALWSINDPVENPFVGKQTSAQWKSLCSNILLKAQIKLDSPPKTPGENAALERMINEDLGEHFSKFTVREIYAAVDAGLNGDFLKEKDSRVFFNPSNLVIWIKAWRDQVKIPTMKKVIDIKAGLPTASIGIGEKEIIISKYRVYVNAICDYKDFGTKFEDFGAFVYSFLILFDLIDPVSKEDIEATAISELQVSKLERDRSKTKKLNELISNLSHLENIDNVIVHPIATRNAVMKDITNIASWDYDDIGDYFEGIKIDMAEYFKQHNL